MTQRRWWLTGGIAASVAVAVVLFAWLAFLRKPATVPAPQPVAVSVATVSAQDVPLAITALGTAQAWASATILSQVNGMLVSVDFVEGADVKAGQLLAQVDPAPYRAALTQAQGALKRDRALLAGARVDLVRYRTLVAQDSIARATPRGQAEHALNTVSAHRPKPQPAVDAHLCMHGKPRCVS
ncbi:biotin/lipoyl-binding protein [Burkholderia anthina]|uniref:biotin/lipoyl-binding protein n=1 Tax=Burkholderia anthina TaxID=179879 RepID=UPI001CF18FF1|nr:biotin/lipoyl-binding protein [Burkholderia anthina]MCA8092700.1 biotin/lipoyl-binding protein [Burkholderia anthina]